MLLGIGIILMAIGGSCIDSDCIIIPLMITAAGAALIWYSELREDANGN